MRKTTSALFKPQQVIERTRNPSWFHVADTGHGAVLNVHLDRLPPPTRTLMVTHTAAALRGDYAVDLVFGQRAPGALKMSGTLVVSMTIANVRQAIYSETHNFVGSLAEFAKNQGIELADRAPDPSLYSTERTVMERASFVAMSYTDHEADLLFYRISSSDFRRAATMKPDSEERVDLVHPVVEVLLDTEELAHLLNYVTKLVPRLKK